MKFTAFILILEKWEILKIKEIDIQLKKHEHMNNKMGINNVRCEGYSKWKVDSLKEIH